MFSNYAVRSVLVSYLQNNSAIIGVTSVEVREKQWQGKDFHYPNIRIRMILQKPSIDTNCDWADLQVSVECYSEIASSMEAENIELAVTQLLDKKTISYNGIKIFALHCVAMIDAVRNDPNTWMAETMFTGRVQVA
jgi:hypothetical protein